MHYFRSNWLRFWPWCVIAALLIVVAAYRWNHNRMWRLIGPDGVSVCQVRPGWTEKEVYVHCGLRSGRGVQPKVAASSSGEFGFQMCSSPGDIYGTKVVLYGCDGHVQSVANMPAQGFIYPLQNEPVSTPEAAIAVSNELSQALVGKQITIHGRFSLRCKLPTCILLNNHKVVYLVHWKSESITPGEPYSEMEDKRVAVTGTLRFYHDPDARSRPSTVARLPDHFYFDADTTHVRLVSENAQIQSKPRRTVKGLPRYMTDSPQPIPEQIQLADAPKTARDVSCFASFTTTSSMQDIVRKCGIPDEHQGSGIFIFLYDMNDGSVVAIGTADLRQLMYVNQITAHGGRSLL